MGQSRPTAAGLPRARFEGARAVVAMCETDWSKFCRLIPVEANLRLTAILESFCAEGEEELPPNNFRWFARTSNDPPGVDLGAFEAWGIVLNGRRAVIDGKEAFFVTEIVNDAPPPAPAKRKRREPDGRQRSLPLRYHKPKGDRL